MTWFFDNYSIGYASLHHNDELFQAHFRLWSFYAALRERGPDGLERMAARSYGPVFPIANLYQSVDQTIFPRMWIPNPPLVKTDSAYRIMKTWDTPEVRLQDPKFSELFVPQDVEFPPGWIFTVLNGVDIDRQNKLLFPGFLGLVCQKGEGRFSTLVFRADGNDLDPTAKVHSAWRVWLPPALNNTPQEPALAWRLDDLDPTGYGGGCVTDLKGQLRRIAFATQREGGPFEIGRIKGDQHTFGQSRENEDIGALHTSTKQIFQRRDGSGDGPHKDSGQYVPCEPGPLLTPVYWRFDPEEFHLWSDQNRGGIGIWKDQATAFIKYIKTRIPPPKQPPPPIGDPFPPPLEEPKQPPLDDFGFPIPDGKLPPKLLTPTPPINVSQESTPSETYQGFDSVNNDRKLAGVFGELAHQGLVTRASSLFHLGSTTKDLRNTTPPFSLETGQALIDIWEDLPILTRDDVIVQPNTTTEDQRYRPGVASGVHATFPGNIGIDDFVHRPNNLPTAKNIYRLYNQIRLAFGQVDQNALVNLAFSMGLFSSTQMDIKYHDALGAITTVLTLTSAGALSVGSLDVNACIRAAQTCIEATIGFEVINKTGSTLTAPLVVKADDYDNTSGLIQVKAIEDLSDPPYGVLLVSLANNAEGHLARNGSSVISSLDTSSSYKYAPVFYTSTGTLSLTEGSMKVGYVLSLSVTGRIVIDFSPHAPFKTVSKAADFTLELGVTYEVSTTGAARAITLPEITPEMDGRETKVVDNGNAATNNITLTRSGASDTIKGGTNLVVATNYASLTLVPRYSAGASKWIVSG